MPKKQTDRVVFARGNLPGELPMEIIRNAKTGKWYVEWKDGFQQKLTVEEAADGAVGLFMIHGGEVILGLEGGRTFYSKYRQISARFSGEIEKQKATEVANAIKILQEFEGQCAKGELRGVRRSIEVLTHQ